MDEIVCDRDDLTLNPLFDIKPMKGLEYWVDVNMFGGASNGYVQVHFEYVEDA